MTIAGHEFLNGVCGCGRHWADIRNVGDEALSQAGIAHMGLLNTEELRQIKAEREAEDARIEAAMGHVWRAR